MSLSRPRYPHGQRPYGTLGRPVSVTVNAFEIKQSRATDFFVYDGKPRHYALTERLGSLTLAAVGGYSPIRDHGCLLLYTSADDY